MGYPYFGKPPYSVYPITLSHSKLVILEKCVFLNWLSIVAVHFGLEVFWNCMGVSEHGVYHGIPSSGSFSRDCDKQK